jgi:hypothetical protein
MSTKRHNVKEVHPTPPAPPVKADPVKQAVELLDTMRNGFWDLDQQMREAMSEADFAMDRRDFIVNKARRLTTGECKAPADVKWLLAETFEEHLAHETLKRIPGWKSFQESGATDDAIAGRLHQNLKNGAVNSGWVFSESNWGPKVDLKSLELQVGSSRRGAKNKNWVGAALVALVRKLLKIPVLASAPKKPAAAPAKKPAPKKPATPPAAAKPAAKAAGVAPAKKEEPKRISGKTRAQHQAQLKQTGRKELHRRHQLHVKPSLPNEELENRTSYELVDEIIHAMFGPEEPKTKPAAKAPATKPVPAGKMDWDTWRDEAKRAIYRQAQIEPGQKLDRLIELHGSGVSPQVAATIYVSEYAQAADNLPDAPPADPDGAAQPVSLAEAKMPAFKVSDLQAAYTMDALREGRIKKTLQDKEGFDFIVIGMVKSEKGPDLFTFVPVIPAEEFMGTPEKYADRRKKRGFIPGAIKGLEGVSGVEDETNQVWVIVNTAEGFNVAMPKGAA